MAGFCSWVLAVQGGADDEGPPCGFDDVVGDDVEVVDFEDALDLGEEALEEAEVATGDPFHGGEGLSVGEIVEVKNFAQFSPVAFENELEFVVPQGSVLVGEAEAAFKRASTSLPRFREGAPHYLQLPPTSVESQRNTLPPGGF